MYKDYENPVLEKDKPNYVFLVRGIIWTGLRPNIIKVLSTYLGSELL